MLVEVIDELTGILVPIFICVVLPVTCVWLVVRKFINADNRRSEVIIEAIKANSGIDADKLAEAMAAQDCARGAQQASAGRLCVDFAGRGGADLRRVLLLYRPVSAYP